MAPPAFTLEDVPPVAAHQQGAQGSPRSQPSAIIAIQGEIEKKARDINRSIWVTLPPYRNDGAPVDLVQDSAPRALDILDTYVLAANDLADHENDRKWDRVAKFQVNTVSGELTYSVVDGPFVKLSITGTAWMRTDLKKGLGGNASNAGYRLAGPFAFVQGCTAQKSLKLGLPEDLSERLPADCRPARGTLCFLALCPFEVPAKEGRPLQMQMHSLRLIASPHGYLTVCRTHAWTRKKEGDVTDLPAKVADLQVPLSTMRFLTRGHTDLELLNGARAPLPSEGGAAPRQGQGDALAKMAYLDGMPTEVPGTAAFAGTRAVAEDEAEGRAATPIDKALGALGGYAPAAFAREREVVLLEGCVVLGPQHGKEPFGRLPIGCRPTESVQLMVARSPASGPEAGCLVHEVLQIDCNGECSCPELCRMQLGKASEVLHDGATILHLNGAVFGVAGEHAPAMAPAYVPGSCFDYDDLEYRLKEKIRKEDFDAYLEFQRFLNRHEVEESHKLTHSCFQGGKSFVTKSGKKGIDTWEALERLCAGIAWCWRRNIPVILMERQTYPVYPMIWDLDAKCKGRRRNEVPEEKRRGWPWKKEIGFCLWDGADDLVLKDFFLLRHFGYILFRFFPDLPHIDLCIFNASGWDRVGESVKVSLHLVAHEIFVNHTMMKAIREDVVLHFEECSRRPEHRMRTVHRDFLEEDKGNKWEEVVDDTTTNDKNGLRMPYCDKAKEMFVGDRARQVNEIQRQREACGEERLSESQLKKKYGLHPVKVELGRPCIPMGILRLTRPDDALPEAEAAGSGEEILPKAEWAALEEDYSIEEWMRMGRCRCKPGTKETRWNPPVDRQWCNGKLSGAAEVSEMDNKPRGCPMIRWFDGDVKAFRKRFDRELQMQDARADKVLRGRWLVCPAGAARWRGGLHEADKTELRFAERPVDGQQDARCGFVVLLCEPAEVEGARVSGVGLVFVKLRNLLARFTRPDNVDCASPGSIPAVRFPSAECPSLEQAVEMVIDDEPLTRVVISPGVHELRRTVVIRKPMSLEGEGQWLSRLQGIGCAALRFEGAGLNSSVHNLCLEMLPPRVGTWDRSVLATVEIDGQHTQGPTIKGCKITCSTEWGACVRATGGALMLRKNCITEGGWGVVLVDTTESCEVVQNEFVGLGEDGIVVVGGAPKIVDNKVEGCGGAAIRVLGQTRCTLMDNKFVDCMVGFRMLGKDTATEAGPDPRIRGPNNHLRQNGLHPKGQEEIPKGKILDGAKFVEQWTKVVTVRKDHELQQKMREAWENHTEEHLKEVKAIIMDARLKAWRPALEARWAPLGHELEQAQRRAADARYWWKEAREFRLRMNSALQVCCKVCCKRGDGAEPLPLVKETWRIMDEWECAGFPDHPCSDAKQGRPRKNNEDVNKVRMVCPHPQCEVKVCLACFTRAQKALPKVHAAPMEYEAAVVSKDWDGSRFGPHCARVHAGDIVGVERAAADPDGWVTVRLPNGARGTCDPDVLH